MLDYGILEAEIADLLNARFELEDSGFTDNLGEPIKLSAYMESRPRPENEAEMKRYLDKGMAWVKYADSSFSPSQSINQVAQREKVKMQLFFQTSNLRGRNGYYKLSRWAKLILLGYQPVNCSTRLAITDQKEISFQNGEWIYMLEFTTETSIVQETYEEPIIGGPFQGLVND